MLFYESSWRVQFPPWWWFLWLALVCTTTLQTHTYFWLKTCSWRTHFSWDAEDHDYTGLQRQDKNITQKLYLPAGSSFSRSDARATCGWLWCRKRDLNLTWACQSAKLRLSFHRAPRKPAFLCHCIHSSGFFCFGPDPQTDTDALPFAWTRTSISQESSLKCIV